MNEEFEKYYKYVQSIFPLADKPSLKAAFIAGAAAMRERCASLPEIMAECMLDGSGKMIVSGIAAAIRKIEVEG